MVAATAVGLEDHRRMLRDHALRLREGHVAAAKAAGVEGIEMPKGDDDTGDIIITGDIWGSDAAVTALRGGTQPNTIPAAPIAAVPADAAPAAKPASTLADKLKTAAIIGALGMSGVGMAASLLRPIAAAVDTDTDTATEIRFAPEGK